MRLVKPLRLSFVHRVFRHQKKNFLVVTVAYCVPLDRPRAPVAEPEMWKMVASDLGRFGVLDYWMFKPRAEVLVTGACYTGEREKGSEFVRLSVSPSPTSGEPEARAGSEKRLVDKRLYVFGDRHWTLIGPSEPAMFTRMPIDYAHAFGGEKYAKNPIGKGLSSVRDESGAEQHPLPNVEDPRHQIKSKGDRPPPASFAGWDLLWPVHFEKKMGSYTRDWVEKNGFALADDVDFSLFNVAPEDQRLEGHFVGDEELHVENMHPDRRVIDCRLPGFLPRCFIQLKESFDKERRLHELPMQIDTVHLFPHRERAIVFGRAVREVVTDDASEVELALCALDGAQKRPLAHFAEVLARRLDPERGALHALRDAELMPPEAELGSSKSPLVGDPLELVPPPEDLARRHFSERARREAEKVREEFLAQGVDEALLPPLPPLPEPTPEVDLENLPELVDRAMAERDAKKAEADRERAEVEAQLQAFAKEHDIDLEAARAKAKSEDAGPPRFSADEELERMRDLLELSQNAGTEIPGLAERLADPTLRTQLLEVEHQLVRAYRLQAHLQEPLPALDDDARRARREEILAILAGTPRDRRDFSGADLGGLDLRGIDLEGAFLEGANLKGARLDGARLRDAVLSRADLEGASLVGADLERANLGRAKLRGADLSEANLSGAILYEAELAGSRLCRAKLSQANTLKLKADGADFSGVSATQLVVVEASLRGAIFRGARIHQGIFCQCDVSGLDATSADFSETVFLSCKGEGSTFAGARVDNLRIVMSSFEKSDFSGASMPGSNLRGAKLAGSNFSRVNLRRSDLSTADLSNVDFRKTIAVECLLMDTVLENATMVEANFMLAIMHRAILRGADVSNANLFCADLTGAVGDGRTRFSGSNVKRALVAGVFHG